MDGTSGRERIIESLREELMGPLAEGLAIDCDGELVFPSWDEVDAPNTQLGSGDEIIKRGTPLQRYGVGILYPAEVSEQRQLEDISEEATTEGNAAEGDDLLGEEAAKDLSQDEERLDGRGSGPEEFELSTTNSLKQSAMGLSFLCRSIPEGSLHFKGSGGRYRRKHVAVAQSRTSWWLRSSVSIQAELPLGELLGEREVMKTLDTTVEGGDGLDLQVVALVRPYGPGHALVTVSFLNRSRSEEGLDPACLFQSTFRVEADGETSDILPYPEPAFDPSDPERRSVALLYREAKTFAVGHGCAADWEVDRDGRISSAVADPLPVAQVPSIDAEVASADGSSLKVPMAPLAGLVNDDDGSTSVARLLDEYEDWIGRQRTRAQDLDAELAATANGHLDACAASLERMREGQQLLIEDPVVAAAFRFANEAVLLQQLSERREVRSATFDARSSRLRFVGDAPSRDISMPPPGKGSWRAFQIAFLLLSLGSVSRGGQPDREAVELIWFPTGGGKTEAYLGLTAFSIFLRRLRDTDDVGVEVLMRYTLRLLTAQQFQRASALICAMEQIRQRHPDDLGSTAFGIGIWLGGDTTPNTRKQALAAFEGLTRGDRSQNRFLLLKCPWCAAQMGPFVKAPRGAPKVLGYQRTATSVSLRCPDPSCDFARGLPVFVIDEDVYEERPDLVIGTVDKFAMLSWRPQARALFGLDAAGERSGSPPGLIIQDELHLISGPLGSMVGLFEPLVEELCTDRRAGKEIRPKIVSSTATIRRYEEQVRSLYGRSRVELFPPPGLDADDSFFARYARREDGSLLPGRAYVGIHAASLPSIITTQVRTFAALMQAPLRMAEEDRDPWWSLVAFFNSLRELGTGLSLFQYDVPDWLTTIRRRLGIGPAETRKVLAPLELTSRIRSDEVPRAIQSLEVALGSENARPVDVCLASTIIEVGIDIDRLSLMTIVGQPKATSTYIQVTGRIGRLWHERPGLVVVVFGPQRPRDRSHYEKFRSYHDRLYAQVEPSSVTPFSPAALDRGLHSLMCAWVRQTTPIGTTPHPLPRAALDELHDLLLARIKLVDPTEADEFERIWQLRIGQWQRWAKTEWGEFFDANENALMRPAGEYVDPSWALRMWEIATSLRNVDAECLTSITGLYHEDAS